MLISLLQIQILYPMLAVKLVFRVAKSMTLPRIRFGNLNLMRMSTLKQQIKSIKVQRPTPKSQIISLHTDELEQLQTLSHYLTSISYLQKNELAKSFNHLEFALTQSKSKFPESVNLHMFLLNRMSILQKILNKTENFVNTLQQVFFMSLSLKGNKSLQTIKHLRNYLTALVIADPLKLKALIEYLQENNQKRLLRKCDQFVGISQYLNGEKEKGLKMIQQSKSQKNEKKFIKLNNLSWLRLLQITNDTLEFVKEEKKHQIDIIIKDLISALSNAEKEADLVSSTTQIQKNLTMTNLLNEYVQKDMKQKLKLINPKTTLLNSQSHIITMNIAHAFYVERKYDLSILFMKMSLEASVQLFQPYRVGLGLVLMSKINQRLKLDWEPTLLDILKNKNFYSLAVLKESLNAYSRFLFIEHRYYEAEAYANQSEKIQANLYAQGLVLPDFDFTF